MAERRVVSELRECGVQGEASSVRFQNSRSSNTFQTYVSNNVAHSDFQCLDII